MEGRQKKRRQVALCAFLFMASLAFYLVWYVLDGVIMTEDAPSYINMGSDREPGYCLYLMVFRMIFGRGLYLHAAVVGQCIVAAAAACAITIGFANMFSLGWLGSAGVLAVQYGITLLNRFVALRRYSYFNSIETEGLAYSLWIFYFLCILGIWYKRDKKSVAGAIFWSVILISIRKQMIITLVILVIVMFLAHIREIGWKKSTAYALSACALAFALARLADCTYNLAFRGTFAPHTGDSSFIIGTQLYLADKGMAENIKDARNREIFLEIMERANAKGYNIAYAGKGWQAVEAHYSGAYDRIKFDIVMPVIRERQEADGIAEADRGADYGLVAGAMMRELLVPVMPGFIKLYFCNIIHGLVTTVLKVHPLLNWGALLLYLVYGAAIFGLCIWGWGDSYADLNNPAHFAWVVLLAIAVNVCFTSLTIYCQMRYMLYNTGLFYQAFGIMMLHILACGRRRQGRSERG